MQLEEQFQITTSMVRAPQDTIGLEWDTWSRRVEKYGKVFDKPSMSQTLKLLQTLVSAGNYVV